MTVSKAGLGNWVTSCIFEKDDNFTYENLKLTMHDYSGLLDDQNYYSTDLLGYAESLIEFSDFSANSKIFNLFKSAAELNADLEITGVFS